MGEHTGERMGDLTASLRALAHPGSVLSLVLLVLNDHVLKQAWPGWVTGKLSDVAGLVVAPLLLAAVLALVRTPRATPVALVATGAGFVFCKTSAVGAALTSGVWSQLGTPTMIRADITDLLALPALYGAWRIRRTTCAGADPGWRRTVTIAVGAALLPVGVLATSATSCETDSGVTGVEAVEGRFTGTGQRGFFVVEDDAEDVAKVDPGTGAVSAFDARDRASLVEPDSSGSVSCDRTGMTCWRVEGERVDDRVVEISRDGGLVWSTDLMVGEEQQARSIDGVDPGCGDEASAWLVDLAVLDTDAGTTVAVTAKHAGLWLRRVEGGWRLVPRASLAASTTAGAGGSDDRRRPPVGPVRGRLFVVHVPPARSQDGWGSTAPQPSTEPTPTCASPTPRVVTPHPLNGPPTTHEVCP